MAKCVSIFKSMNCPPIFGPGVKFIIKTKEGFKIKRRFTAESTAKVAFEGIKVVSKRIF